MNMFNKVKKIGLLILLLSSGFLQAQEQIYTGYFNNKAVSGFDVVSYFSESKPVQGSGAYQYHYQGADWYFSSQENLDKFKQDPQYFAPQYGGYCAWAMARNKAAPGNAPFWTIYEDKLYLNYDQKVLDTWRANKDAFIKKADVNWAKMDKE